VEPARILAVVGVTETETAAGGGCGVGPGVADLEPLLQEARAMAIRHTSRNRKNGRSAEDILRIVSVGGGEEGTERWARKGAGTGGGEARR